MSRTFPRFSLAGVASIVALVGLTSLASADPYPQDRHGFMLGANLGGGTAAVSVNGGGASVSSEREGGVAGNFRFGWGLTPNLSLGLESNAWTKSQNGTSVAFTVSALTATYYPNPLQGFYVRAGVGGGSQKVSVDQGGISAVQSQTGFGFTTGLGYEMRLGRHWSLGPSLDYAYNSVDLGGGGTLSANYVNFSAAFDWYFQ